MRASFSFGEDFCTERYYAKAFHTFTMGFRSEEYYSLVRRWVPSLSKQSCKMVVQWRRALSAMKQKILAKLTRKILTGATRILLMCHNIKPKVIMPNTMTYNSVRPLITMLVQYREQKESYFYFYGSFLYNRYCQINQMTNWTNSLWEEYTLPFTLRIIEYFRSRLTLDNGTWLLAYNTPC